MTNSNNTNTDAVSMLKADHEKVQTLFSDYEKASTDKQKKDLVTKICTELKVHAQLEEEIFYPAFKAAHHDKSLIPEATVEHDTIRNLISQIQGVEPVGEVFNARVKVLLEYVKHHVKEEHTDMFTDAKTAALDLNELGAQMIERKASLLDKKD